MNFADEDYAHAAGPRLPLWATTVFCKGTEARLDERLFRKAFGSANSDLMNFRCPTSLTLGIICRLFPTGAMAPHTHSCTCVVSKEIPAF